MDRADSQFPVVWCNHRTTVNADGHGKMSVTIGDPALPLEQKVVVGIGPHGDKEIRIFVVVPDGSRVEFCYFNGNPGIAVVRE